MSAKPNYFKLGLFILISLVLLLAGIILFGSGVFGEKKIYFETFFKNSVSGLTVGAQVQDNGVQIGTVEHIGFIRNEYTLPEGPGGFSKYRPYVRVVCSVNGGNLPIMSNEERQEELDVLIKNGLRLRLSTNILTGQGFIEAEYVEPKRYPVESFPWTTVYPYIPSAPSTFTTLKDSVDKILHRLEQINTKEIADNLNTLLETTNGAIKDLDVTEIRENAVSFLDKATDAVEGANIPETSEQVRSLFKEARQTNEDLKKLLETSNPQEDMSNIAELVNQMDTTVVRINQLIQTQSPKVIELLVSLQQVVENVNRLTENLGENPSELIFSKPPDKKEDTQ